MLRQTQAEILIETLAELLNAERDRPTAVQRLRYKAHANRFMKTYRAEYGPSGRPWERTPQGERTTQVAERQIRDE